MRDLNLERGRTIESLGAGNQTIGGLNIALERDARVHCEQIEDRRRQNMEHVRKCRTGNDA